MKLRSLGLALATASSLLLLLPATGAADEIVYECNRDICVVDPDSGSPTNLTSTSLNDEQQPVFSPDGTRIAFYGRVVTSSYGDLFQLTVADPGTATNVSQTAGVSEGFGPIQWSPGGERLSYTSFYDSNMEVAVSPASGTAAPTLIGSSPSGEYYGRWTPDGNRVAYAGQFGIYIGNADGTGTPALVSNTNGGDHPDLSPDGTKIAFNANQIRVANADGTGSPVTLSGSTAGFIVQGPFFSPDGSRVVWAVQNDIYIRNSDGSGTTTTVTRPDNVTSPRWSPDGTRIAFAGRGGPGTELQIWVMSSDGTGTPRSITPTGFDNLNPEWKPDPDAEPPVEPPVNPPIDPPVNPTRPPVTVSLANFRRTTTWSGSPFIPISAVICPNDSSFASNPKCSWLANASGNFNTSGSSGPRRITAKLAGKKKTIRFPGVPLTLEPGESGDLLVRVPRKARKVLKPGKKYKLRVSVEQNIGTDPTVTAKKTLKLKVKKK